jgi:uncharacterized protein with HEPN domain
MTPLILDSLLEDILAHCLYIIEDTNDATYEEFETNRHMRQIAERNLIVIGIGASRIQNHFPETYNDTTMLKDAISLRNRLAHGYDRDIGYRIIWYTTKVLDTETRL